MHFGESLAWLPEAKILLFSARATLLALLCDYKLVPELT